jgi:integrase/recombinase XerC
VSSRRESTPGGEKRPRPQHVGRLGAYARRGPDAEGRWYWQVALHQDEKQQTVPGGSGWFTAEEVVRHLSALVLAGADRGGRGPATTVDDLLVKWLAHQDQRREKGYIQPRTYEHYYQAIERLRAGLGALPLHRPAASAVQAWIDALQITPTKRGRPGLSPRLIRQLAIVLRLAWAWGLATKLTTTPLPAPLEWPKVRSQHRIRNPRTPTLAEARAAVGELSGEWRLLGDLLLDRGARIGEVAALTPASLDPSRGRMTLCGKTGPREVAIPPRLLETLAAWPGWSMAPEAMAHGFRQRLEKACRRAKVPPFSPHGLRRAVATVLIAHEADPKSYEALMGHSHDVGKRIYAQVLGEKMDEVLAVLDGPPTLTLYTTPVRDEKAE